MGPHSNRSIALIIAVTVFLCGNAFSQSGTCSGMAVGQLTSLNGFVPFPSNSLWNTDISTAPVDPNSANYINFIGSTVTLHPDFGAGTFHNQTLGIPYQVVAGSQAKVAINVGAYADESDPGPKPIPPQCPDRRLPQTGERRSSRAGVGKRRMLALRALSGRC